VRDDPELLANAVEELLRYDSPVQMARRVTLTDTRVGDATIEAGSFVALVLASANRDPRRWGEPGEQLDVTRADASRHCRSVEAATTAWARPSPGWRPASRSDSSSPGSRSSS
jgi:cytochrome P450